eukprot:gene5151-6411_t
MDSKNKSSSSSSSSTPTKRSQLFLLKNAFNTELKFTNKEISQNVHWMRQIIGILVGIIWGVIPLQGLVGIVGFLAVNAGLITIYYSKVLEIEDGDFKWELFQEGFMASFAMFLVI